MEPHLIAVGHSNVFLLVFSPKLISFNKITQLVFPSVYCYVRQNSTLPQDCQHIDDLFYYRNNLSYDNVIRTQPANQAGNENLSRPSFNQTVKSL